jgi:hypothetical protein
MKYFVMILNKLMEALEGQWSKPLNFLLF